MAVPDTTTFSLQDVVDEINPTTNNLVDCIADAVEASYDPTYYTSPATSLLEFRNYGGLTAFSLMGSWTTSALACAGSKAAFTNYHDGAGEYPTFFDLVYTDSAGTTPLDGGSNWWKCLDASTFGTSYQINASGQIIAAPVIC